MLAIQQRLSNLFYVILSLPSTAMGFALSVQIAALSWILSTKYGLKIEEIGLVWAAGPIAGIFGQVVFGLISDNTWFWGGRRRPFILIGGALAALSLLALPNLEIVSATLGVDGILGVAIAVALSLDISINVGFNPTRSIIADVTPEGEPRTKGYTWMQTISGTLGVLAYFISVVYGNINLIYIGAVLAFLMSVVPPFFITEPRELTPETAPESPAAASHSLTQILVAIKPLWGFLVYAVYGIIMRLSGTETTSRFVEIFCLTATVLLIAQTLGKSERNLDKEAAGRLGFQKVLAAHSFTWIGVQTMFIYMFAYVQYRLPDYNSDQMGQVVSWSFLILNAVGALLPAIVLQPITRRIGRVRTHTLCIAVMAAGYTLLWLLGSSPTLIYLSMGILGVGWAATVSLPFAIMSQKVNQAQMGLYMGLFNLSVVLPQLVASLGIGEYLGQVDNKSLVFLICAGCLAFSALAWSFVRESANPDHHTSTPTAGGSH